MARTLTVLALGLLLGATATLLLRPTQPALPDLGDLGPLVVPAPSATAVVTAAAREGGPGFYRRLADANASELAAMIAQAAAEPPSTDRELALAVLLKRHSELDVMGAVRLAREARVGGTALGAVYGAWARTAPGQALTALSTIESPDAAADVALALMAALGNDAAAVARVTAVLAAREELEPAASAVPPGVAAAVPAAALPFVAQRSALGLAAQRWADIDPRRALAVARELDDEGVRLALESAALRSLTRAAPNEALAELAALGSEALPVPLLGSTVVELARSDPERLLAAAANWSAEGRRFAESAALQQLAQRDPLAAMRYVERMPLGAERQALTQTIARSYGKRDPVAALAWARSVPGQQNLVASVIGGVAEQDPNRAIDLALELTSPIDRSRAVQFIAIAGVRQDASFETIANRLLTIDDPQLQNALAFNVVSMWASRAPDRAMTWLLANAQDAPPNVFMQIGEQLARRDPRNAAAYTAQVPQAAREPWIHGVSQGYAQADAQGAIDWLGQFRGEPGYERAAVSVAMSVAQRDGAAAARLVDELDAERIGPQAQQLANAIATNWANVDPPAAADWAIDRPTEQERAVAVRNVTGIWANQDADAARQWALRLPQGATRDGALTTLLTATVHRASGGLDARVLSAFASETAKQQAVLQVVQGLAYADPARARTIADTHLTDAALRANAERVIEAAKNGPPQSQASFGTVNMISPAPASRAR
jgi:hypothetical protein